MGEQKVAGSCCSLGSDDRRSDRTHLRSEAVGKGCHAVNAEGIDVDAEVTDLAHVAQGQTKPGRDAMLLKEDVLCEQ